MVLILARILLPVLKYVYACVIKKNFIENKTSKVNKVMRSIEAMSVAKVNVFKLHLLSVVNVFHIRNEK